MLQLQVNVNRGFFFNLSLRIMYCIKNIGEFSAAGSSNDLLKVSHLNDGSRSNDQTKFCPFFGLPNRSEDPPMYSNRTSFDTI